MKKRVYVLAAVIIAVFAIGLAWGRIASKLPRGGTNSAAPTDTTRSDAGSREDAMSQVDKQVAGELFTGKAIKAEDAVKTADLIVVGRLTDLGLPQTDAPGEIYYENAKLEITRTLKGNSETYTIPISFSVQKISPTAAEKEPEKGQEYLFFIKKNGDSRLKGVKILPATESNLSNVTNLISIS